MPSVVFRCNSCDFNFRRFDRPLSEVLSHFQVAPYSDEEAEKKWLHRRAGFYRYLIGLLDRSDRGEALLDIGCAFGHFLDFAEEAGYEPVGTEVSEAMAALARRRCTDPIVVGPLDSPQLETGRFDVVTFVDSFYYFDDPLATLQQARRLLKPRGTLLMRVTNRNPLARLHAWRRRLRPDGAAETELPFWTTDDAISCHSRRSLDILMQRTGFRIVRLTGLEQGKAIDSLALASYYRLSRLLCRLTRERICVTPGLVCLATPV